jgi:PIN domain nuclease of toxin-antitoxin system
VSIKSRQSKPDFQVDARFMYGQLLANGYLEMPVTSLHTVATGDLPMIHKDPFDRILVAQAKVEDVPLLTCDAKIAEYPVQVFFVQK